VVSQFGDSQKLRLVRILRSTVMVRVGGGWVALDEFLVKNDPCRGKHSLIFSFPSFEDTWTSTFLLNFGLSTCVEKILHSDGCIVQCSKSYN
jgi:hypothetical protein